jgi:putative endonuclease
VKRSAVCGRTWERLAESFLNDKGLRTIQRNFNSRVGELDLVLRDGSTLVFAEVRYRASDRHGTGAESVSLSKQKRIIRAAQKFLQLKPQHPSTRCRFDVVSIGRKDGRTLIDWIPNAFELS